MNIKPEGFSEAGISTSDLDGWVAFLTQVGGYQVIWRGESPQNIKGLWQAPSEDTVLECLLGNPNDASGHIRLFQFSNIPQQDIRLDSHTWDSGGIFDIDIRVSTLLPFAAELKKLGWQGVTEPIDWAFGPLLIREWLTRGPDSVTMAVIERLSPPLEDWDGRQKFGHVFNSSQVVADMDRAVDFYEKLGFVRIVDHRDPLPGRAGEMLGLAPETAARTPVEMVILQPHGVVDGSVELVRIRGVEGQNFASRGKPYNLGLNLLRFPVKDLRAFAAQTEKSGISPVSDGIVSCRLEPYGETEFMAVETPDGVWLEFYQAFS